MNMPISDSAEMNKAVQVCDIPIEDFALSPFTLVVFGGAGDLARRRLLPTLFHIFREGEMPEDFAILGTGLPALTEEAYRAFAESSIREFGREPFVREEWERFARCLSYSPGELTDEATYAGLGEALKRICAAGRGEPRPVIYYLAVPPSLLPAIVENLSRQRLCRNPFPTKIVVEKPFGRDRESAAALNRVLRAAFDEGQIYRLDHYLAKETVQNILFFRFSNSIFEPLWDRRYIAAVQITAAETIGVEHRGRFYEETGVVRDMGQNHLLQLIAMAAMEPPTSFSPDRVRDERVKVFRSLRIWSEHDADLNAVRGQYGPGTLNGKNVPAYRQENDVAPQSPSPTYFAARFFIDNWRWAGVPFYVRSGKRLSATLTQIVVQFKQPPLRLFSRACEPLEPNFLKVTIQPREEITLCFGVKAPFIQNAIYPAEMTFGYQKEFRMEKHLPYERLLVDCLKGDLTLFVREDETEAAWDVVDPIIRRWENVPPANFPNYAAGAGGPAEADTLIRSDGREWIGL